MIKINMALDLTPSALLGGKSNPPRALPGAGALLLACCFRLG
jgi:hypothetical protein